MVNHFVWGAPEIPTSQVSEYEGLLARGLITRLPASESNEGQLPLKIALADGVAAAAESPDGDAASLLALAACRAHAHAMGYCSPCRFITKNLSCWHGSACHFCHEAHSAVGMRPRPNKVMRRHYKRLAHSANIAALFSDDVPRATELMAAPPEGCHESAREQYLRGIMRATIRRQLVEGNIPGAGPFAATAVTAAATDTKSPDEAASYGLRSVRNCNCAPG
eukprot:NODE_13112_length_1184_cov_5.610218.p1 GENE.NODE_13112_length_1184_cov_5.610218~~NODE_13112_length_1184_cov_5.610218.p1  ORF type:complete len:222 (-),score=23.78 NODE_13112_length_1184_cov_5.610218:263-928(-)